jgi:hypothetical protein
MSRDAKERALVLSDAFEELELESIIDYPLNGSYFMHVDHVEHTRFTRASSGVAVLRIWPTGAIQIRWEPLKTDYVHVGLGVPTIREILKKLGLSRYIVNTNEEAMKATF